MVIQTASDFCWVQPLRTWHLLLDSLGLCCFLPFCGIKRVALLHLHHQHFTGDTVRRQRVSCRGSLQAGSTGRVPHSAIPVTSGLFLIFVSKQAARSFIWKDIWMSAPLRKAFSFSFYLQTTSAPAPSVAIFMLYISVFTFKALLPLTHCGVDWLGSVPSAAVPAHGEGSHLATWH